jgi:hypothetical protein
MKKLILISILAACLAGCGGSSGGLSSVPGAEGGEGNFLTTSVEVEQRYLYILNSGDGTISAFVFPATAEEGHGHAHGRILAQVEEEEGPQPVELTPSPFNLGHTPIDMGLIADSFLVTLDASSVVRVYELDGITGLLELRNEFNSAVPNPRRLRISDGVAVLGDQLNVYGVDAAGNFLGPALFVNTATWVDVALEGGTGVASTPDGAVGFSWETGAINGPFAPVILPGATRGEVAYASEGVFVVNSADGSVSQLSQSADGQLTLANTFDVGPELATPTLITSVFNGEDLVVADHDSLALFHPGNGGLENEGEAALDRAPARLFHLPESEALYVGHATGDGTTTVLLEEAELHVIEEPGPGGQGPTAFGYAERFEIVTETTGFE